MESKKIIYKYYGTFVILAVICLGLGLIDMRLGLVILIFMYFPVSLTITIMQEAVKQYVIKQTNEQCQAKYQEALIEPEQLNWLVTHQELIDQPEIVENELRDVISSTDYVLRLGKLRYRLSYENNGETIYNIGPTSFIAKFNRQVINGAVAIYSYEATMWDKATLPFNQSKHYELGQTKRPVVICYDQLSEQQLAAVEAKLEQLTDLFSPRRAIALYLSDNQVMYTGPSLPKPLVVPTLISPSKIEKCVVEYAKLDQPQIELVEKINRVLSKTGR